MFLFYPAELEVENRNTKYTFLANILLCTQSTREQNSRILKIVHYSVENKSENLLILKSQVPKKRYKEMYEHGFFFSMSRREIQKKEIFISWFCACVRKTKFIYFQVFTLNFVAIFRGIILGALCKGN